MNETRICLACNEDGFGPSAFGYYVARELLDTWKAAGRALRLTVLNRSAERFNRHIYDGQPVEVRPVDSLIRLPKPGGEMHVPQALALLESYAAARDGYAAEVRRDLEGCDVAIDVGVPLFARAAARAGVARRITLFDHSWAATLRLIAAEEWTHVYRANPVPGPAERAAADRIATWIEEDEVNATDLFLFDEYITPPEFVAHWTNLGLLPRVLPGVLGRRATLDAARAFLDATLADYGQRPAPSDVPLVLVSPGGTPVWDDQLPRLIDDALAASSAYVLVIAKDLGPLLAADTRRRDRVLASDAVRYYGPQRGSTQQALLPAFSRIITRAGGGTVNDALAAGVPLAFVEEPQVQIKLIERECARLGIGGSPAPLASFQRDPWGCIDRLAAVSLPVPRVAPALGAEKSIVARIA